MNEKGREKKCKVVREVPVSDDVRMFVEPERMEELAEVRRKTWLPLN